MISPSQTQKFNNLINDIKPTFGFNKNQIRAEIYNKAAISFFDKETCLKIIKKLKDKNLPQDEMFSIFEKEFITLNLLDFIENKFKEKEREFFEYIEKICFN